MNADATTVTQFYNPANGTYAYIITGQENGIPTMSFGLGVSLDQIRKGYRPLRKTFTTVAEAEAEAAVFIGHFREDDRWVLANS